ncbi:Proteinase inhibitor I3 [Macleaya cordata]|uniref:Proteinase inhibitor I3 n=1 Tax=Macleaya cordata TaxID=56857 RepID=A0A200QJP0_MACCD|nr:Proteinase inhibitor I3 [Macleaya cordata]
MRTTTTSFLFLLSLFFFTFATKTSSVSAADTEPEAVRDITGKILRTGADYYMLSVVRGAGGGGVTLGNNRNGTFCLLDVVQEPLDILKGTPVTFTPVDPKKGVIRVSTDLNIEFSVAATICMRSLVWQLADFDESTRQYFITTRGVKGNPGNETLSNWFKIERTTTDQYWYKLVFCPTVCDLCKPICKDIGIYVDKDRARRLALLSDEVKRPFLVMFARADDQLIKMN